MLLAVIILALVVFGLVFAIGASLLMLVVMLGVVVGALSLAQVLLGWILECFTGKRPKWIHGPAVWTVECVLAVILFGLWYTTPLNLDLKVQDCTSIGVSNVAYGAPKDIVTDEEKIEAVTELLEQQTLRRRINLRFLNEGMVDGTNGYFLSFYNEDNERILKVRIYQNYIGITRRKNAVYPNEVYTYYRAGEKVDLTPFYDIISS